MGEFASYYSLKKPQSFSGVVKFQKALKKPVKKWLETQDVYTLFKPARKKYQRRKTIAPYSDFQHQADLADFSLLKKSNDGNQFLLIVIDVFSRFAYCEPVKSKKSTAVIQAFENIYRHPPNPVYLQTDRGTEFTNKALEKWLRQQTISLFQTYNFDTKAALAERLIRTLKTKLWRYFKANNTFKYIDVLDDLMVSYNNSYHRTIKTTPSAARQEDQQTLWIRQYGDVEKKKPKLSENDFVRVSLIKNLFRKGYEQNWSKELFIVQKALPGNPPYYRLKDLSGEPIMGTFYEKKLQLSIKDNEIYEIDSILKKRKRRGRVEFLVSWSGYPEKYNSWITEKDLINYG